MNYAEDRLDRRARSSLSSGAGNEGTTQDQLACDLKRAHDAIIHSHRETDGDSLPPSVHRDLRAAHELAGKTLRDGGRNRQAVFHFGMAWRICHWLEKNHCNHDDNVSCTKDEAENEWRAVGDYAQICELAGFPEIGVLSLLFYHAGGDVMDTESIQSSSASDGETQQGCGCGMGECGTSPCFIAFPIQYHAMDNILQALDSLSISPCENFPSASDILAQLAHMTRKSSTISDPVAAMHEFLSKQLSMKDIPPVLQFWGGGGLDKTELRILPPVILLLLLKLLYSSPISGPFLQLACISMPYLSAKFPPASAEGRLLARCYKSHWAYYVFIRSLISGERVKKHRKGKVIRQTPVWDIVFGLEALPQAAHPNEDENEKRSDGLMNIWDSKMSNYVCTVLQTCSLKSAHMNSKSKTTNNLLHDNHNISLPCTMQQKLSSFSTHPPIFVVGDSHVLSLAWQTLCIDPSKFLIDDGRLQSDHEQSLIFRTAFPFPATGMKAWHVRSSTQFFTHYNLHSCLQRLPPSRGRTIILSAGEIDCREGIGGTLLQGYYRNCSDAVERTVIEYLSSLANLAEKYNIQILVMPVAPHAYRSEKNGKSMGRAKRRETMQLWNMILRRELSNIERPYFSQGNHLHCKYNQVFLLDYEEKLQQPDINSPVGYVLNPAYNADYTHVNSAVVPLIEDAILQCGCDLTLI